MFARLPYATPRRHVDRFTRDTVAHRQRWRCALCGNLLDPTLKIDHVIPLALGGLDHADNMQALCPRCHDHKTPADNALVRAVKRDMREGHCARVAVVGDAPRVDAVCAVLLEALGAHAVPPVVHITPVEDVGATLARVVFGRPKLATRVFQALRTVDSAVGACGFTFYRLVLEDVAGAYMSCARLVAGLARDVLEREDAETQSRLAAALRAVDPAVFVNCAAQRAERVVVVSGFDGADLEALRERGFVVVGAGCEPTADVVCDASDPRSVHRVVRVVTALTATALAAATGAESVSRGRSKSRS